MKRAADYRRGLLLARAKVMSAGLDPDLAAEQINTYALALHRTYLIRDAWEALGSPITSAGSKGQIVAHPLLAVMESSERALGAADAALTRRRIERRGNFTGSSLGQPQAPDRRARLQALRP